MNILLRQLVLFRTAVLLLWPVSCFAQVVLNEILFDPPGTDNPFEYIELRGAANQVLPEGTYLVTVEGSAGGGPGTIQNLFNLSGRRIGGNGCLVLLQKDNPYSPNTNATVLINTGSGAGWGSGSSSSVGHRGNAGRTSLENASVTFFLIHSLVPPSVGQDIDSGNTGLPHGSVFDAWTVLDSVGVLGPNGAGDFAYGAINFRLNTEPGSTAQATGLVVPVGFTPRYLARRDNTAGSAADSWVAGAALGGSAPAWTLGSSANTYPGTMAGARLNHLGEPNFGAPGIPGVLLAHAGNAAVNENGGIGSFTLALNTKPSGPVVLRVQAGPQLEISTNGTHFQTELLLEVSPAQQPITYRALNDFRVDAAPRVRWITNSLVATSDPIDYPSSTLVPDAGVEILEDDWVLLNELKVNPPGTNDAPYEFVELAGSPGTMLANVWLLGLYGEPEDNPGTVAFAWDLTGLMLGERGLLLIAGEGHPYSASNEVPVITHPALNQPGGGLGNSAISFLLVSSASLFLPGDDLDNGNNGVAEKLPIDLVVLDSVAFSEGGDREVFYTAAVLELEKGTPEAATRFPGRTTPNARDAWFWGEIAGPEGDSLTYHPTRYSENYRFGTPLSPGGANQLAPTTSSLEPISGVIGDPSNPSVTFQIVSSDTGATNFQVWATSSNLQVVPDHQLSLLKNSQGLYTLRIQPAGVGYSDLFLWVSDGSLTGRVTLPYAASAPGRPGGIWHLGASDGSTAIPIGPDQMIIGDDEKQVLRIYSRLQSALPENRFDFEVYLGLPDLESGLAREVDVEASTRVGDRLFWIGSHGHGAEGELRTNRNRIFCTELSGNQLTYVGRYDHLMTDLVQWDALNLHGKGADYYGLAASDAQGVIPKAPDGSGLSIEGLAMMPGSTNAAFVAFRAPYAPAAGRTHALIVPVLNFAQVAASTGPPESCRFGTPIELDLYGRGIRSLEGQGQNYLIIGGPAAGSTGAYPQDFRLYTWTGNPQDQPQQLTADLAGLNPEGIVELPPLPWTPQTQVQILSDCGAVVFYGDAIQAKFLTTPNFKKSRSDLVALGTVTKPVPIITSTLIAGGHVTIRWRALKGLTYRLEYTDDPTSGIWSEEPGDVAAQGPYAMATLELQTPSRFYRLRVLP